MLTTCYAKFKWYINMKIIEKTEKNYTIKVLVISHRFKNYSHIVCTGGKIYQLPKMVGKKSFSLISPNLGVLQHFATIVRSQRFPDSYKGSGILYSGETIVCKEGKKT